MRPLSLDYVRRPSSWPAWMLLVVAVAVAAGLGRSYLSVKKELYALQAARDGAASRAPLKLVDRRAAYPAPIKDNLVYANGVVQSLALPWDMLFRTVEGTGNIPVALLAVQPDPQKRVVRISGEAKDYAAVLTYIARLDESGTLRNVHLLSHQRKQDDPQHPLLFTVAASWRPEP
jgi:type IV pilus assembly PilN-like protein